VGFGNHKYFAVFLVWAILTDICFFGLSLPYVIDYANVCVCPHPSIGRRVRFI
jgi:hypothetical protein